MVLIVVHPQRSVRVLPWLVVVPPARRRRRWDVGPRYRKAVVDVEAPGPLSAVVSVLVLPVG